MSDASFKSVSQFLYMMEVYEIDLNVWKGYQMSWMKMYQILMTQNVPKGYEIKCSNFDMLLSKVHQVGCIKSGSNPWLKFDRCIKCVHQPKRSKLNAYLIHWIESKAGLAKIMI